MEKKTAYDKIVQAIVIAVSIFAAFLHIGNFTVFTIPSILFYAWHLLIGLVLIFLYYPLGRKMQNKTRTQTVCFRIIDWVCIILTLVVSVYVITNYETYVSNMQNNKLTDELFCRDVVDRIKKGYEFLLPYYDYFLTLPSDPEPETLK